MRQGADRRRVAGDADAALPDRRRRTRSTVQTTTLQRRPAALRRCATDFAGNVACLFPTRRRDRQQPAGVPAQPRPRRRRGLAPRRQLRLLLAATPTRARPARSAAPTGGSPARPATTPASTSRPARDISALADRTLPRPGVYALHLWLRDEAGNADSGSAIEMTMRLDDVPPGVAFEAVPDPTGAGAAAHASVPTVSDEHSGPAKRRDRVPAAQRRALDRAAEQARARE